MVKILVSGCGGAMGRAVTQALLKDEATTPVGGLDPRPCPDAPFPVFADWSDCHVPFDVIIDFSHPKALDQLVRLALRDQKGVVIATTGHTQEQTDRIEALARELPVFFSANMSMGVALMRELCIKAARVLGGSYDIEVVEKHHNQKIDAPSGTAFLLANAISSALPQEPRYVYDRHSHRAKRGKDQIGIHSIRGGTIPGEHEVLFAGAHEVLTISHTAYSKELFATGAIAAAKFLAGRPAGLYTMEDLMNQEGV